MTQPTDWKERLKSLPYSVNGLICPACGNKDFVCKRCVSSFIQAELLRKEEDMKIYKVVLKKYDYDQYDGFIVFAKDENDAIETIKEEYPPVIYVKNHLGESYQYNDDSIDWEGGYVVEEVKNDGISRVLLGSYNAG